MDNSNVTTEQILGKDLSQSDLDIINKYRQLKLGRTLVWDHKKNNYFHERTFFLVRNLTELVSFGTLRPLKVYVDEKEIEIMAIQAVVSVIEHKGYGKLLMQQMIKYADEKNLTLIGFCKRENVEFYRKSGLDVFENAASRFFFKNEEGKEYSGDDDVIHYSSSDSTIVKALLEGKKIVHYVPHW